MSETGSGPDAGPASTTTRAAQEDLAPWRGYLVVWGVVAAALLVARLSLLGLTDPSEARYAEIGREMVDSGDWIVPRLLGVPHLEKPPLAYWSAAAGMWIFGRNEFAVRLGATLALLAGATLTGAIARRVAGLRAGLVAAGAVALSPFPLAAGAACLTDSFLLLAAALFHHSVLRWSETGRPATLRAAVVALAIGVMAKGHVIFLFTVVPLVLCRRDVLRQLVHPVRLLLFAVLVVPWFVAIQHRFPQFMSVHGDKLFAFFEGRQHHRAPIFIYLLTLLLGVFPVAPFAWKGRHRIDGPVRRQLLAWLLVPFVVLTLARSRTWTYILPAVPPLAVLGAAGLPAGARRVTRSARGGGLLLAVGIALALFVGLVPGLMEDARLLLMPGLALGVAGAWVWTVAVRRDARLLGFAVIVGLCMVAMGHAHEGKFKIHREIARRAERVAGDTRRIVVVATNVFSVAFYVDRPTLLAMGPHRLREEVELYGGNPRFIPPAEFERFLENDADSVFIVHDDYLHYFPPSRIELFRQRRIVLLGNEHE